MVDIVNLPEFRDPSDYWTLVAKTREAVGRFEWITGIYQIGTIACPGISDIDLVIVTDDAGFDGKEARVRQSDNRYYFLHDALWIRQRELDDLSTLFCTEELCAPIVDGEVEVVRKYSIPDELKLIYLIEICLNKLVQAYTIRNRPIDARALMTRASSVRHSVSLARSLGISGIAGATAYSDEIDEARKNWIATRGGVELDYLVIRRGLATALSELLNAATDKFGDQFCSNSSRSIEFFLRSLGARLADRFEFNAGSGSLTLNSRIANYYSAYDNDPENALQEMQAKRKQVVVSHYQYLKSVNMTFSLRSAPIVPFGAGSRYWRATIKNIKNLLVSSQ